MHETAASRRQLRSAPETDAENVNVAERRELKEDAVLSSGPPASDSMHALAEALRGCHLTLNDAQLRRLHWLTMRNGRPEIWSGDRNLSTNCRFALVTMPPTGLQTEDICDALAGDAFVVIPCGEDPAYDRLKAQLFGFGTVGVGGDGGPHQMWWGGRNRHASNLVAPRRRGIAPGPATTVFWNPSCRLHDVLPREAPPIVPDTRPPDMTTAERLLSIWRSSEQPTLWIDPDIAAASESARLKAIDCDFAVVKSDRWRIETSTLYFGRRPAAEALLRTWTELSHHCPEVDNALLLDQAWCLVTSQTPLDTLWLPPNDRPFSRMPADSASPVVTPVVDAGLMATEPLVDPDLVARVKVARRAERTGFPDLIVPAPADQRTNRNAVVIVRDIHCRGSHALAATIEALATTFTANPASFDMLEVMLCERDEDVEAALAASRKHSVLVLTPAVAVAPDAFSRLAATGDSACFVESPRQIVSIAAYRARRSTNVPT